MLSTTLEQTSPPYKLYLIAAIAALMGIGQNGLLVALPILTESSNIPLYIWSIIIATGSVLFLPSSPFWGQFSDRHGPKPVVIQALAGFVISFSLMLLFVWLAHIAWLTPTLAITGLILARVIYGLTVSGMVPAAQHWAIILQGEQDRITAIAMVSAGLSCGRLLGPLLALGLLQWHQFGPLIMMCILPLIALLLALKLKAPCHLSLNQPLNPPSTKAKQQWQWPSWNLFPMLIIAISLCTAVALLQYTLSPLIEQTTHWPTDTVSQVIGALLTISAASTLSVQLGVVKTKRLSLTSLFYWGASLFLIGFIMFLIPYLPVFFIAISLMSAGTALLVPAYTTTATQLSNLGHGTVTGYISMSHTIGYGLAAMMAASVIFSPYVPIGICIVCGLLCCAFSIKQVRSNQLRL
ncbi:MFS transporter [Endozoicomonas sp. SM1973]|uniref:MFS transporter n=1 Tax=Spartinivicinus marinus TaxID=2994442 RepID=A0A853HV95_9GAMM|nr:MFS transporter [Spartinivicinus marinus]MCX4028345.1 MFS transporter [Spartinivicinus marinus]NYZ65680.1 MFS transporter [Spartinivicinus marinus]